MLIRRQGSTLGRGSHKAKQLTGHGTSCLSSGGGGGGRSQNLFCTFQLGYSGY